MKICNELSRDRLIEIFNMSERKDGKLSLADSVELLRSVNMEFQYDKVLDCYYYEIPLDDLKYITENEVYNLAIQGWVLSANEKNIVKFC